MEADEKSKKFIERVCEKIFARELNWEATTVDDAYQTTIGKYIVVFSHETQRGSKYVLTLFNVEGQLIDSYNDEMFDPREAGLDDNAYYYRMKGAFEAVRRQVMGVDKALDEILEELK